MEFGFAKVDITPRVGVELCGFGPYLNRHSIAVRDRLWARAMAVRNADLTVVLVSCDLVGVQLETTHQVRAAVAERTGIVPERVMVHCTHTHSGPTTVDLIGWGDQDAPYMELLPGRIAKACIAAVEDLRPGRLLHAEVPCEGVGLNRQYDKDAPPLEDVLDDEWRPAKPELTDTVCHVLKVESSGRMRGFLSNFGCHPVVCCATTRYIHGDYCGVATNLLDHQSPGAVGMFLQGAQGDVNTCVVHKPEQESMLALDVIAARYARNVHQGLLAATPIVADSLKCELRTVTFSRQQVPVEELRSMLAEREQAFCAPDASDESRDVRMATVYARALRGLIWRAEAGLPLDNPTELQGIRIGPVAFLGAPFEIFQAIKNEVKAKATAPIPLVMGLTNDLLGYAPDAETAQGTGYAAKSVPFMLGELPFADIATELSAEMLALDASLAY